MPARLFDGVGVALATLFSSSGDVDEGATADLARRLVDLGVTCVLVAGSTGEAGALETSERMRLVGAVRTAIPPQVPVMVGTGAPSARQAVVLTRMAVDAGADAILALSPPLSADPTRYYEQLADVAGGKPLLGYHFPAMSSPGIPVSSLRGLPIAGLKDSSGDLSRLYEELDAFDGWLYTGSADLVLAAGALGCAGAILAIANLAPEQAVAAFNGDGDAQRQLASLGRQVSSPWPSRLKAAVAERFGTSTTSRMG